MSHRLAAASCRLQEPKAHFGGPDLAPGVLRAVLKARVAATPPGGSIRWATYYFNDHDLAEALMRASDRGVDVRLVVEGAPHHVAANRAVVGALKGHGLGGGLRVLHDGLPFGHPLHMHAKVYVFDHRDGSALLGSYNPLNGAIGAGGRSLGDHDVGHNLLVEAWDAGAIGALGGCVDRLFTGDGWLKVRGHPEQNRGEGGSEIEFRFFPRRSVGVVEAELNRLCAGDAVRGCVSHIDDGPVARAMAAAAARGVHVWLHLGPIGRRVSAAALKRLHAAGAELGLYRGPAEWPMHCKFLVIQKAAKQDVLFGSFNLNTGSRWLNHEVLARSSAPALADAFQARFLQLQNEAVPAFEGICP